MTSPRYTLLGDGPSDRCLVPVIDWLLGQIPAIRPFSVISQVADLRQLHRPASRLEERIAQALQQFPCEVLFVHRDAEGERLEARVSEVHHAARQAGTGPYVPVVPVRMTEAWFLIDEAAIRRAAGNPRGTASLSLPPLHRLEEVSDPKEILLHCLTAASEKSGRHLKRFHQHLPTRVQLVASYIRDFSPLRRLPAFAAFERATAEALSRLLPLR